MHACGYGAPQPYRTRGLQCALSRTRAWLLHAHFVSFQAIVDPYCMASVKTKSVHGNVLDVDLNYSWIMSHFLDKGIEWRQWIKHKLHWRFFWTFLCRLFILFTNTSLNISGFEMLTVGTAKVHWLYYDYICILVPVVRPQLVQSLSSQVKKNSRTSNIDLLINLPPLINWTVALVPKLLSVKYCK